LIHSKYDWKRDLYRRYFTNSVILLPVNRDLKNRGVIW
jgi:hypothetical protein